ncbi:MAG TPA: hypothetical protein VKP88_00535, partial [Candidatus Paceibacterota bacterium]|nr:hypothetical protein [Candidatus Paceibacterota bacterium]
MMCSRQSVRIPLLSLILGLFLLGSLTASAQFNPEINYQGKLNDSLGVPVDDGTYNMAFHLYTAASGGTVVWSSTTTVPVTDGLFSYMLGSDDSLTSVDFNQTLYLGVNIGATGTPAWDGEMSPRKVLGAVPAAFEAQNAQTLDNIATSSFLRGDIANTATALLSFSAGLFSDASSTITDLNTSTTTVTTFIIDGQEYTSIDGAGLQNDAGQLAVDFTTLDPRYASTSSFDTEGELETLLTDATNIYTDTDFSGNGTGLLFFDDGGDTLVASSTISASLLDATVLVDSDIGSAVQAFDANTTLLGQSIDLATEVDGTLDIASTSLDVTATGIELSGDNIILSSGYTIPLSASTTNWNNFYDTPSNRITAGTGLSWSGNTIDLDNDFGASIDESELNIPGAPGAGYVLQASSTAAGGFVWVATSTLGVAAAGSDTTLTETEVEDF